MRKLGKTDKPKGTFFCLQCGLDKPKEQESDYEQEVCKTCTKEED